ncbi:hypothetical protein LAUMK4_05862 [Mycobacterium persicum]|uniref:Bacteriophage protein n=1 Tax=Mycobacterium persicum TaxID=1487726 RepID=A0ABY6RSP2_9MYCO|nr:hypothetical protein [Mycobacterium persicum]ORB93978.1 hypothetical protein B1T44_04910 [Mycobacterium persicum]VAZ77495.1 hypothetical protein LAUMK15_03867 [Mycobacterium persicum]VBA33067.1 hypothetical protein LAUMK4_05862 [Mycobacterium persicum]
MSDDIIARAEAALEGVTDGPWTWDGDTFSDAPEYKCPHGTQWCDHGPDLVRGNDDGSVLDDYVAANYVISSNGYDASGLEVKTADAEFIAASRSLVPELVAELKTTRAQLRQVARQIGLFLEDGERNRLIVALAITDDKTEEN